MQIIDILVKECNYFEALKKRGCHLSIMMFHYRFRKYEMQVLNYSIVKNKKFISEREVKQFKKYMNEYQRIMKGNVKEKEWNLLQAIESINFILESMLQNVLPDMIYVLNLSVNFYSQNVKEGEKFIINAIRDFSG